MNNTILELKNLCVSFKLKNKKLYFVLRGINLALYRQQKIAIVGESASGKTTLANSILLLNDKNNTLYQGNIFFYPLKNNCEIKHQDIEITSVEDEKIIKHIRGYHISIIFQDPFNALNPVIKIGKQIEEIIKNHNPTIEKSHLYKKTMELLKNLNLKEQIYNMYPHQLSGGQLQRVCIAIALANNPEILIADEPTTSLDASLKEIILKYITNISSKNNFSLILITHDINIIKNYVDYIYIIYGGEIIEHSSTQEIFRDPLHPYTQFLLSCMVDKTKKGQKLPYMISDIVDFSEKDFIFNKCIFLKRCNKKLKICEYQKPNFNSLNNHYVKCWLYNI